MNCPRCQIPLLITNRQGIEIDYCQQCRGVWLDRGELDKVIERSMSYAGPGYDRDDDDDDDDDDRRRRMQGGQPYQQPGPYGQPPYGQQPYPPQQYPPPYPPQQQPYPHDYRYKKKKSFWSELFD